MPVEHPVERTGSKRFRHLVPVRQMHASPQRQVGLKIVDSGRPLEPFVGDGDRDGYRRAVDEGGVDVDRRYGGSGCSDLMLQPEVSSRDGGDRQQDAEQQAREPPDEQAPGPQPNHGGRRDQLAILAAYRKRANRHYMPSPRHGLPYLLRR